VAFGVWRLSLSTVFPGSSRGGVCPYFTLVMAEDCSVYGYTARCCWSKPSVDGHWAVPACGLLSLSCYG
jgi:hypothetical protein